jgi:hypothetical protein
LYAWDTKVDDGDVEPDRDGPHIAARRSAAWPPRLGGGRR